MEALHEDWHQVHGWDYRAADEAHKRHSTFEGQRRDILGPVALPTKNMSKFWSQLNLIVAALTQGQ